MWQGAFPHPKSSWNGQVVGRAKQWACTISRNYSSPLISILQKNLRELNRCSMDNHYECLWCLTFTKFNVVLGSPYVGKNCSIFATVLDSAHSSLWMLAIGVGRYWRLWGLNIQSCAQCAWKIFDHTHFGSNKPIFTQSRLLSQCSQEFVDERTGKSSRVDLAATCSHTDLSSGSVKLRKSLL